jgi:hypothetical protein
MKITVATIKNTLFAGSVDALAYIKVQRAAREMERLYPKRVIAWGRAVQAMNDALTRRTSDAWKRAHRQWTAMAALYTLSERDRQIYANLADECRRNAQGVTS